MTNSESTMLESTPDPHPTPTPTPTVITKQNPQVIQWLKDHEVEQYAQVLQENGFDSFTAFKHLNDDILKKLKITKLGHRLVLVDAVRKLKAEGPRVSISKPVAPILEKQQSSKQNDDFVINICYEKTTGSKKSEVVKQVKVVPKTSIVSIVRAACVLYELDPALIVLTFCGEYLDASKTVADYQIHNGDSLDISLKN